MRISENILRAANREQFRRGAACCARCGVAPIQLRAERNGRTERRRLAGEFLPCQRHPKTPAGRPSALLRTSRRYTPRAPRFASDVAGVRGAWHRVVANKFSGDQCKSCVIAPQPVMPAGSSPCDRQCLYGFVDQFFGALGMHNPYGVAMAPEIKYTENGQIVKPGEGMWKTFSRRGTYRVYLADPSKGAVGFYGDFSEFNGTLLGVMAVRFKVQDRRIAEVEVITSREELRPAGGLGANTAGIMTPKLIDELDPKAFVSPDVALLEPVDTAARTPREQLIAATNGYFDGFSQDKGSVVPFADKCSRRENGMDATGNSAGRWPILRSRRFTFSARAARAS